MGAVFAQFSPFLQQIRTWKQLNKFVFLFFVFVQVRRTFVSSMKEKGGQAAESGRFVDH
jgi:hypothetical protein